MFIPYPEIAVKKSTLLAPLVAGLLGAVAPAAFASHIWVTDPSVNGTSLDSPTGFTNPSIVATVGSTLNVKAGFYDYCGGTCVESWTMHFAQTGGSLTLSDITLSIAPSSDPGSPLYYSFDQLLGTAGSWTGFLQPIQFESCPSYRYGDGVEGGDGCGSPSESIPFSLRVVSSNAVPEPGSLALFGLGAFALAGLRRRKQQ